MKKCSIMLSVLAMLCSSMTLQTISVSALEAATIEEMYMQNQETQEFPDPSATYTKAVENNLEFRLYADYAVLTKCNDREVTAVEIPAEINGLPVVGAIDSPFGYCRKLQKITLPDSFEHFVWLDLICTTAQRINMGSVGAHSGVIQIAAVDAEDETLIPSVSEVVVSEANPFYTTVDGVLYTKDMKTLIGCPPAKEMQSLNIPEQTERIGDYAFVACYHLENAVIPSNITHINNGAFAGCINLKSIAFPKHITSISGDMCYNCESLSDITFNGDIDTIGYGAFSKCSALETFEIPDTVIYIGSAAFEESGCFENINDIYYVDNWVVGSAEEIENVDIREGTIGIAEGSFFTRNQMHTINVPASVQYLNYIVFAQLTSQQISRMDYHCPVITEKAIAAAKSTKDFYIYDPECEIFDSEKTIPAQYKYIEYVESDEDYGTLIDGKFYKESNVYNDVIIHGYAGSTAQAYAEKYERQFEVIEDNVIKGDANADGKFDVSDVVAVQKWLLSVPDAALPDWKAADLCQDGVLNALDLSMLKRRLLYPDVPDMPVETLV